MFYLRLNRIYIYDNREKRRFLGLIGPDTAEVKVVSFVSTEHTQLPDLSAFLSENDPGKKMQLLTSCIEQVVSSRSIPDPQNIKDNSAMTFGPYGYIVYQGEKIPESFDWQLLVYESDQGIRENAQLVQDIVSHKEFDSLVSNIFTVTKTAITPQLTAAAAIGKFAIKVITDAAKNNKDDLIGVMYTSLIRKKDFPHGEKKLNGVWDLTRNMQVDFSVFGFENPNT